MFSPIKTMFMYFPIRAYLTVLILLAISLYTFAYIQHRWEAGKLSKQRGTAVWLLVNYTLLLLFFTVLGRRSQDYYRYNFNVGYSFRDAIYNGTPETVKLILVNIAIFVPVGFLGTLSAKQNRFLKGVLIGFILTLSIEFLQLLLRNGTCEIDDLISNMTGTLFGCLLANLLFYIRSRIPKKQYSEPESPPPEAHDDGSRRF